MGPLWSIVWLTAAAVVVELVVLGAHALVAAPLLGRDGRFAVRVLFFGAGPRPAAAPAGRTVAVALAGPVASLVVLVVCAVLVSRVGRGPGHDALWALAVAGGFGVLQLAPVTVHGREGGLYRSPGRVILDARAPEPVSAPVASEASEPAPPAPLWFGRDREG